MGELSMRTYEFDLKDGIDTDVKEVENTKKFLYFRLIKKLLEVSNERSNDRTARIIS